MYRIASLAAAVFVIASVGIAQGQPQDRHLEIKVEPVAYLLGGAGGHVGYQSGRWAYTLEVFGLDIPESMHGNDGFEASPLGAEVHVERFFRDSARGFYIGPEAGVSRLDVTHSASGKRKRHVQYSIGVRGGYRWYPGLGDLFLTPVVGLGYTLNDEPIEIDNETFDSGPLSPWGTVGVGWSF